MAPDSTSEAASAFPHVGTVYIAGSVADRPRVRHLRRDTDESGPYSVRMSMCGYRVQPADKYDERRTAYMANSLRTPRLRPIDYAGLPLCKLCSQKASKP